MATAKTEKKNEILRRPLYVYDLPPEVLQSLSLKKDAEDAYSHEEPAKKIQASKKSGSGSSESDTEGAGGDKTKNKAVAAGAQSCSLCGLALSSFLDRRGHFKSDLHHYNLKQKMRGLKTVSEAEFEKLVGDLDESLSGSDASGSEDEDEDAAGATRKESTLSTLLKKQAALAEGRRSAGGENDGALQDAKNKSGSSKAPLLWFGSPALPPHHYFGMYRVLFTSEELEKEDALVETIRTRQLAPISISKQAKDGWLPPEACKGPHVFLCMIGGGHFAAMVVSLAPRPTKHGAPGPLNREATVLAHKTFHRYTTRKKQGGSQSANDNAKGAAHSAGSSLRRYNEQALVEDVRALLRDWKALLDTSDLLFIRATGTTNRRTLFGPYEGQVLRANDARIRGFPFSTRRATQNELMRSFIELSRLKVREMVPKSPAENTSLKSSSASDTPNKTLLATKQKLAEAEEAVLLHHTTQVQSLVRRSKLTALLAYLQKHKLPHDFRFFPADSRENHHAPTCLHLAAAQNVPTLVLGLLTRAGADPTLLNGQGKTPFALAGDRIVRDAFRVARNEVGEGKWDWDAAGVPAAMKKGEAEARADKEMRKREVKESEREVKERERRRVAEERLEREGPKVPGPDETGSKQPRRVGGKGALMGGPPKNARERREEDTRGMTDLQKMRLERERRARAAEERLRRMQQPGGET